MLGKKKAGLGRQMKRVRTHDKTRSKHGGEHGLHVVATKNIKIKALIIGKRFREPRKEDIAKLAESLKKLGQLRAITVRRSRLNGEYPVIAGATLIKAAKMLNWTRVRADVVKCTDAQSRQWEIAENLYRADLTALEEAEHIAEWVRLIEGEAVSRQNVPKPKGGRPEGAITKAARDLPIKGKSQQARRKRLERGLKIGRRMLAEGKAAAIRAGLDDDRSALYQVAKEETAEAQVELIQDIVKRKTAPKGRSAARGIAKKKTKGKRLALPSSLSAEDRERVKGLLKMWHDAQDLRRGFAKETPAVREGFIEKIRQSVADNDSDQENDLDGNQQDDEHQDDQSSNWTA